jgi:hypothetical protein
MGPVGIWWGFVVSNLVGAALAVAWFKRGTWRDADVRGGPGGADETSSTEEREREVDDARPVGDASGTGAETASCDDD